jgi:aspartyl protease family protein
MGTFSVTIDVGSPDRQTWHPVEALVDTGATFTWLPDSLLRQLGYAPEETKSFELGDGRVVDMEIGDVVVRIGGEVHTTVCAFATSGEKPAVGAVTLEQFLLAPDPVTQRLVPVMGLRVSRYDVEGEAS